MANKSKGIGTRFETQCVNFLRERLDDDRIERRALHGGKDMGDIFGLYAHGHEGIIQCKNVKQWGPKLLDKWKERVEEQRGNADADFALLIVHEPGCGPKSFGRNSCYLQIRDLEKVMAGRVLAGETARDMWVRITVEQVCQAIEGKYL